MTKSRNRAAIALVAGAIIAICGVGAGTAWFASTATAQPAVSKAKTLAQVIDEPHGRANGDPIHAAVTEVHKGVDPGAAGVGEGTKKQAAAVQLTADLHPAQPSQVHTKGDYSAGCTVGYGHGRACLPTTPPSAGAMNMSVTQMPWTCSELRTLLPNGIAVDVKNVDPARLDSNHDGVACGVGD